jgi:hypothetical protein
MFECLGSLCEHGFAFGDPKRTFEDPRLHSSDVDGGGGIVSRTGCQPLRWKTTPSSWSIYRIAKNRITYRSALLRSHKSEKLELLSAVPQKGRILEYMNHEKMSWC